MFDGEVKILRDNVHGYIKIPIPFVRDFIDTEIFQRLRFIEQTGMRVLYPSARHDRYIHSLGTFHLGQKAYEGFKSNVKKYYSKQPDNKRNHYIIYNDPVINELFWEKCGVLFLIACLLHDCGHAPFSHTLEFIYEQQKLGSAKPTLEDKLKQYYNAPAFIRDFDALKPGSEHERMSSLVVYTEYGDKIRRIVSDKFSIIDDDDEVEFIARMILGCTYGDSDTDRNQIKNCFINLLNSKSIDVDSLDYIIRDAKLSGIDNMAVDVDRLLSSLTIVERTNFEGVYIDTEVRTNVLGGKLEQAHPSKACIRALCRGDSNFSAFDGEIKGKLCFFGNMRFKEERDCYNVKVLKINGSRYNKIVSTTDQSYVEIDATIEQLIPIEGASIKLDENFNGFISGNFDSVSFEAAYIEGKLRGKFTGSLLGYYASAGGKLKCELGFHKSSLSVLQNVVSARNYEYQWIYSHHKVVYYSNYLLIELLRKSVKCLLEVSGKSERCEDIITSIMSWETMSCDIGEERKPFEFINRLYYRTNDSDLVSLYKHCYITCQANKDDSECSQLLHEFFSRQYRRSVWKSYAEYCMFFSDLSDIDKVRLYDLIRSKSKLGVDDKYGYFTDDWNSKLTELGLCGVVWVNGNSKLKRLDPDKTYILFKDQPMSLRSVSFDKDLKATQHITLFYLYYNAKEAISPDSIAKLKTFLKDELTRFLKS